MKNHLVITIIVLLLCLTSCGIGKRTLSQEVQADVERQAYDSIKLSKEIESIIEATVAEALSKEVSFNVTDERRIWSPPDSSGKQFIIVERIVRTSAEAQELTHKTETSVKGTSQDFDSTTVAASIEDLEMATDTDVTEKDRLPWWQKTLMIIGAAVILYVVIKIVLKFV